MTKHKKDKKHHHHGQSEERVVYYAMVDEPLSQFSKRHESKNVNLKRIGSRGSLSSASATPSILLSPTGSEPHPGGPRKSKKSTESTHHHSHSHKHKKNKRASRKSRASTGSVSSTDSDSKLTHKHKHKKSHHDTDKEKDKEKEKDKDKDKAKPPESDKDNKNEKSKPKTEEAVIKGLGGEEQHPQETSTDNTLRNAIILGLLLLFLIAVIVGVVLATKAESSGGGGGGLQTTPFPSGLTAPPLCLQLIPPDNLTFPEVMGRFCKICALSDPNTNASDLTNECSGPCCRLYYPNNSTTFSNCVFECIK